MKILITGACGHIGSHLIENLHKIKKVKKAILVDNLKSNRYNSLFNASVTLLFFKVSVWRPCFGFSTSISHWPRVFSSGGRSLLI